MAGIVTFNQQNCLCTYYTFKEVFLCHYRGINSSSNHQNTLNSLFQRHKTIDVNSSGIVGSYSIFVFLFFHLLDFFEIWIHAVREGPP